MDDCNNEKEILEQILEENRKRTLYSKITAVSSSGIFAAIVLLLLLLVPRLSETADNVNAVAAQAQGILGEAETTLAAIENAASGLAGMSESLSLTGESVNRLVTDNAAALADTVKQLGGIDYEGLNEAIRDLQDAVEPFAKFVNRFK